MALSICRDSKQKLGDVLKPVVSFLKLTSEYVINLEHARNTITEWQKKSATFAKVISSVEVSILAYIEKLCVCCYRYICSVEQLQLS